MSGFFPWFPSGNAELTGDALQELIRMASRQVTSQSPIVPLEMPDGVCFVVDPTAMKELLAGDSAESQEDLDSIFSPPLDEGEVAAIADQRIAVNGFAWVAATVNDYDGLNYTLLSKNVANDGTFFDPSFGSQQTYTAREFSGNQGVPIGADVWAFLIPGTNDTNLYYFFCPELTQIVRITDDVPNEAGLYPAMLQRFIQPPGLAVEDDSIDAEPQLTGSFQDQEEIWVTTPGNFTPSNGSWMLGRHVGEFDDGLKIFAVSDMQCNTTREAVVFVPPVSITNDCRIIIPKSRIGIAAGQVVYIRDAYEVRDSCNNESDELCLCPAGAEPVVIYTTTGQVLGCELVIPKAILTLVNGVLTATPAGSDSVAVCCCPPVPSSSSSSSASGSKWWCMAKSMLGISFTDETRSLSSINILGPFSASMWVNYAGIFGGLPLLALPQTGPVGGSYPPPFFYFDANGDNWEINSHGTTLSFASSIALNNWYHVCVVFDGSNALMYVNGALLGYGVLSYTPDSSSLAFIGHIPEFSSSDNFSTLDVRIYNAALSSSEVGEVYNNGIQSYSAGPAVGLQMWLKCNEGTGSLIADSSGNGNDFEWLGGIGWLNQSQCLFLTDAQQLDLLTQGQVIHGGPYVSQAACVLACS